MSYFFGEPALAEHLEHVAYYEARQRGLGGRYAAAFESAMEKVCADPGRFPVEHAPALRRIRVPGFPFNVLYRQAGGRVEVLAVAPHRRRPGYWLDRV